MSKKVKIAILDSGLSSNLLENANDVVFYKSFTRDSKYDFSGHGSKCYTFMNNFLEDVEYYILKIINNFNKSCAETFLQALIELENLNVNVINLSLSFLEDATKLHCKEAKNHLHKLHEQNKIIVCSQHNRMSSPSYPASLSDVIGVEGAPFKNSREYWFNIEKNIQCVGDMTTVILGEDNTKDNWFSGNSKATVVISCEVVKIIQKLKLDYSYNKVCRVLEKNSERQNWSKETIEEVFLNQ